MSSEPPLPKQDVVFVHGPSDQGDGYKVIRKRDETLEIGEIHSVKEGRPIHGELVTLKPRKEHGQLFDVEVVVPKPAAKPAELSHGGPAQVATDTYRDNWETIFGSGPKTNLPN